MSALDETMQAHDQPDLVLQIDTDAASGTLRPHGELDVATVPQLERAADALWADGAETLVLDLGAVTFFDSSGVRLLIRLQSAADADPGRGLALADCSDAVERVLELTRLRDRFQTAA